MCTLLRRIRRRIAGGDGSGPSGGDDETAAEDDRGFAGSLLDRSVNRGHGETTGAEADRELTRVRDRAETLNDEDRR